ncbi:TetR/AcrR family transcriptional regulator [Paenibacillus sp. GCM10027626]|uniref:TetR/AcrR family transcriptional regulator n=1 Tax=Paenibacillus sp. GCM10027626 TaxID=3273411 RepID=UPI00363FA497
MEQWMEELLLADGDETKMTEKQAKILEAAIAVFAEKGFASSSTNEIAQRAGVAEGTIFRHYKTKKDLLLSIVAPTLAKFIAPFVLRDFNQIFDAEYNSYEELLRAIIVNRIEFLNKHKRVLKILVQEIPFHPDLQEQMKKFVLAKVLERFGVIIAKFKASGQLADLPVATIVRLTASGIVSYVLLYVYNQSLDKRQKSVQWDEDGEREATIRFIMKGLAP